MVKTTHKARWYGKLKMMLCLLLALSLMPSVAFADDGTNMETSAVEATITPMVDMDDEVSEINDTSDTADDVVTEPETISKPEVTDETVYVSC